MIGYKAFYKDLTCAKDFQYKIGETYTLDGDLVMCENGFHFCKNISDLYRYYHKGSRICKVEALGKIITADDKYCTDKIKILEEVTDVYIKKCNLNDTSTGYCNTGNYNSGDCNSGDHNSGKYNSGYYNNGNYNSGDRNTGDHNSGSFNNGRYNSGDQNSGIFNSGNKNIGCFNTGDYNNNDFNTGSFNTGDCNIGDYNNGFFNTTDCTIRLFNKDSNMTITEFYKTKACKIIKTILIPCNNKIIEWIPENEMTEKEKKNNPESEVTLGYLKPVNNTDNSPQDRWNNLPEKDKKEVMSLPNFDKEIFKQCTGIDVGA